MEIENNVVNEEIKVESTETNPVEVKEEKTFTQADLDKILSKTTFIGAFSLGIIALIPSVACDFTGITTLQGIGATSLIIMVGVALDFINQVRTNLLPKNYESFLKQ